MIKEYDGLKPSIEGDVYIAEDVTLVGDVRLKNNSSIWYGCVIRADYNTVEIGENTNIQDGTIIHIAGNNPTIIGSGVTVGHGAIVHGCTIEDNCLIGMGAVITDHVVVGEGSLVAAGCVLKEKTVIPPRSMVVGVPGKVIGNVDDDRYQFILDRAEKYVDLSKRHKEQAIKVD